MLPPQIRQSVNLTHKPSTALLLRAIARPYRHRHFLSVQSTRSLSWWWRRACSDYVSHLDPKYDRFMRYRTLKTRAKLIDKLRRRGKWDWDADTRPFFTDRHIRYASHWNGTNGRAPIPNKDQDVRNVDELSGKGRHHAETAAEEEDYELSQREKQWKDRVEWMRKRVEEDPYEAVFGKRIEPFWSPLMPEWVREEMGWTSKHIPIMKAEPVEAVAAQEDSTQSPASRAETPVAAKAAKASSKKENDAESVDTTPNGQLTNYSYASTTATSWNSWENKTRRQEWDSISGETRHYEYDPISNRMVQIKAPQPTQDAARVGLKETRTVAGKQEPASDVVSGLETRRSIVVPTNSSSEPTTSVYFPSLLNSAMTVPNLRPSSSMKQDGLGGEVDNLTADQIRASVGQGKRSKSEVGTTQSSRLQPSLDRLQSREIMIPSEPDDSAAHEATDHEANKSLPRNWDQQADLLQADRVRRTRGAASDIELVTDTTAAKPDKPRRTPIKWIEDMDARKAFYEAKRASEPVVVSPQQLKFAKAAELLDAEVTELRTRMHNHEHRHAPLSSNMEQTEERAVSESTSIEPSNDTDRYKQKIRTLREELDRTFKQSTTHAEMQLDTIRDLQKQLSQTRQELTSSQSGVGNREKYARKVQTLREELDRTFLQSNAQAQMQLDRIRELEEQLRAEKDARNARVVPVRSSPNGIQTHGLQYDKDGRKWQKRAITQSEAITPAGQELHSTTRDNALAREVRDIYEQHYGKISFTHRQKTLRKPDNETGVVEVETNVNLGDALAEYESTQKTAEISAKESRAALLAHEELEAHELQARTEQSPGSTAATTSVRWAEPPVYKVLAYDSGNDIMTTATTSSNFTGDAVDVPLPIQEALSQLYQPARFVPFFASFQDDGFQAIYGTKDLLLFRQVHRSSTPATIAPSLEDHGLLGEPLVNQKNTSIVSESPAINPIDGTTRVDTTIEPIATRLANAASVVSKKSPADNSKDSADDIVYRHYPRVSRQERVFSGTRLGQHRHQPRSSRTGKRTQRVYSNPPTSQEILEEVREHLQAERRKGGRWRSRIMRAVVVGLAGATVVYLVGSVEEKMKEKERLRSWEGERWQEILDGKRGRWE